MGPGLIEWYLTNNCFLNCIHCLNDSGKREGPSFSSLIEAAKQIVKVKPEVVNISGGDPLKEEKIFDLMRFLKDRGTTLTLSTSGWKFDSRIAKEVMSLCWGGIQFSLDGSSDKTHDYIRGRRGAFSRVIAAIETVRKISSEYDIEVNFTLNRYNYNELEEAVAIAEYFKVTTFKVSSLYPLGRTLKQKTLFLSEEQLEKVLKKIIYLKEKHHFNIFYRNPLWSIKKIKNQLGQNQLMAIEESGQVKIAPYMPFVFGNIYNDDLQQIWEQKMINFFESKMFKEYLKKDLEQVLIDKGEIKV